MKPKFLTGWMPFLSPNQQHQVIKSINIRFHGWRVNTNKGKVTVRTLGFFTMHTVRSYIAHLVQTRSSATAEGQRVSYTRLSRLTHWSCTSLSTASVLQLYNRLAKLVSTLSANKPCDIRTLSWIGHSRSFKVTLIGAGRNPEWSVVVMCNQCRRYFWNLRRYANGKTANSSISTTSRRFEDVPARNAFEYLQMIYTARNLTYIFVADSMGIRSLVFT